jgi:hypothetical protein
VGLEVHTMNSMVKVDLTIVDTCFLFLSSIEANLNKTEGKQMLNTNRPVVLA